MFGGVPESLTFPFLMPSHRSSTHYPPIVHSPPPEINRASVITRATGLRYKLTHLLTNVTKLCKYSTDEV
jgi:hypothetical protein